MKCCFTALPVPAGQGNGLCAEISLLRKVEKVPCCVSEDAKILHANVIDVSRVGDLGYVLLRSIKGDFRSIQTNVLTPRSRGIALDSGGEEKKSN
jgi:hypothetical protein